MPITTTTSRDEPDLYIGGRRVPARGERLEVENPATEEIIGAIVQASTEDVEDAIAAAKAAFPGWAATPVPERAAALRRVSALLTERADLFADVVHREQGSPLPLAQMMHVQGPTRVVDAAIDALEEFPFVSEIGTSLIRREPVGVIACITPWNLPLHQILAPTSIHR